MRDETIPPSRSGWAASAIRFVLLFLLAIGLLCAASWSIWVYAQIEHYAMEDQAAPSDVICVFGAAEYGGKPSPVLRARLDHALALYEHGIAPIVLTLGEALRGTAIRKGRWGKPTW